MSRLVLDAGAFVAFDKGDTQTRARIAAARKLGIELVTTSPVVAQVWRDGRKQALLASLVAGTRVDSPDEPAARRAGELLARAKQHDAVDALVVRVARAGDTILTSDPDDIEALVDVTRIPITVMTI